MSPEKIVESVLKAFDKTVIIAGSLDKGIPENALSEDAVKLRPSGRGVCQIVYQNFHPHLAVCVQCG